MGSVKIYILKKNFSFFKSAKKPDANVLESVQSLKKVEENAFIFVHRFDDMLNENVQDLAGRVILDGALLEGERFSLLPLFWKLYYLNKFKYILSEKIKIEGCIYSKIISENIFLEKSRAEKFFIEDTDYLFFDESLLVLDREDKNFTINNAALFSRFRKISFVKYDRLIFFSKKRLKLFLLRKGIDRTIFVLPYRNILKKKLLSKFEKISMPYYVFERGAFPGCFVFDDKGFNFDSKSYRREFWDRSYTDQERDFTRAEVSKVLSGNALEDQAGELETIKIKKEILHAATGRKIIFVPLQRPWDSVIRYFNPLGYRAFVREILKFAKRYDDEYFVVLKKHPREKKWPYGLAKSSMENIFLINQNAHINDILKLSYAVALINSGVGVLSLIFKKRVFYFGKVFYEIPGCNSSFSSAKELKDRLGEGVEGWNGELSKKFLNYLYNRYYSLNKRCYTPYSKKEWVYIYTQIRLPGLKK